jgi:hypothetical protein
LNAALEIMFLEENVFGVAGNTSLTTPNHVAGRPTPDPE